MTREEAIEVIKAYKDKLTNSASNQLDGDIEALEMAIKALENPKQNVIAVVPCGDAISRQATLEPYKILEDTDTLCVATIRANIMQQPSVNPKEPKYCDRNICIKNEYNGIGCDECEVTKSQKTGHWKRISIDKYSEHAKYWYRCDRCGKDNLGNTDWCPNCGARMVEPQESEE